MSSSVRRLAWGDAPAINPGKSVSSALRFASARRSSAVRAPERVGGDHHVHLLDREAGTFEQADPKLVLDGGGDGLVDGGERGGLCPAIALDLDGLMGGPLGAEVVEHPVRHRPLRRAPRPRRPSRRRWVGRRRHSDSIRVPNPAKLWIRRKV